MAKLNKTPDPAEAAFSAIEEALNGQSPAGVTVKAQTSKLKLPRVDTKPDMAEISTAATVPSKAAPEPSAKASDRVLTDQSPDPVAIPIATPSIAPPAFAANDDRLNSTVMLAGMQQKASSAPIWFAALLSLGWLAIVAYAVLTVYDAPIQLSGGYFAPNNLPSVVAIALAAFLPVVFMFSIASMVRRAQEMRIAARAMTQAVLRLSQPEAIASDSVFSLGQAIRREVASMGDGIERAVARASELEALVHSEVSQLERSYSDNELKIRMLLDELANQREAINNSASSVRTAIMGAHDNLSSDLQTVSQRITDSVSDAGQRVTSALDERREQITLSLSRVGDDMIDQISTRSSDLIERLSMTGDSVNDKIATTSADVTRTITESGAQLVAEISDRGHELNERIAYTGAEVTRTISDSGAQLVAEIADRGHTVTAQIESTGNTVTSRFSESVETVNASLNDTGNALVNAITERAQTVSGALEITGQALISTLTQRSTEVNSTMRETGEGLISTLTDRSADVNSTMRATGESLIIELGLRGSEVTQRIEETGTRIADTVTSRGDSLAARLVDTSDRINDSITVHGKSLEESLAVTGQQAATLISEQVNHAKSAFEGTGQVIAAIISSQTKHAETLLQTHADDIETRLEGHADQVRARLAETGKDVVLAIATQGNRVNEALSENARGLSGTLEAHSHGLTQRLQTFDETVGQRLQNVETLMTTHGDGLMVRLETYSGQLTQDLTQQTALFEQTAAARASALSGSFDDLISRVDTGLERRGLQLNEALSKRAIDIARIMGEGGRDVTAAMEAKAAEFDHIINTRTSSLADTLGARAEQITEVLTTKASEINATLGGRATEIADTLDNRISSFEERVVGRLDTVAQTIDQKGFQFAASLVQRTEAINTVFTERGDALASVLETKGAELVHQISSSTREFQSTLAEGTETSVRELTQTHQKLTGGVAAVLGRLNEANGVLNGILEAATTNLESVETGLVERVKTLESTMGQIISDTARTTQRVDKQVTLLRDMSGGVLQEAATISDNIHARGMALAKVAEDLTQAQTHLDGALGDKQDDLRDLVKSIEQRSAEMETIMQRFNGLLHDSLATAEQRARDISTTLLGTSESATAAITEQYDLIRTMSAKERERTSASLRAAYEQAVGERGHVFEKTTEQFREAADQLRSATGEITQELEATRAEVNRSTLSMPRDISAQTSSIKRAVGEQLKAFNELNTLVERTGLDVAPPLAARRAEPAVARAAPRPAPTIAPPNPVAPTPPPRPAPVAKRPEPAAPNSENRRASSPKAGGGWLSDLLGKASSDEAAERPVARSSSVEQGLESLDVISTDIARLVDQDAVAEVWDRYTEGDRNVFSRRLYTLQGQQTFDEVRRRYRREAEFREAIDRYVEEFERLLRDLATEGRDPSVARTYLLSDTGKVYTMLAHASGRFE
ncbi:MAG: hypothetical protein ACKVON_00575 [Beijerinckiaceae bacterium]